jgi:hypothetical protein
MDWVIDCGRFSSGAIGQQAIFKTADHVVVVTKADPAALAHALWTIGMIRQVAEGTSSFVVIGPSQFRLSEIEQNLQSKLLGMVSVDERSAAMACGAPGTPRRFAQSALVASARRIVARMLEAPDIDDGGGRNEDTTSGEGKGFSTDLLSAVPFVGRAAPGENGAHAG